jgi:hypothetical protein
MNIGYARVSTVDQTLALQEDALKRADCAIVFRDTVSGAKAERPGLQKALDHVRAGDTLIVWRLDRLGRSLAYLIETVQGLEQRGVGFKSVMESIDTTTPSGKLVFHLFAALARVSRAISSVSAPRLAWWRRGVAKASAPACGWTPNKYRPPCSCMRASRPLWGRSASCSKCRGPRFISACCQREEDPSGRCP